MTKASVTRGARGFSLVEVTLALGVAAFCLLALFGLLPIGVASNQISVEQTAAASVAASVIADLRGTPTVSAALPSSTPCSSSQYAIPVPLSATTSIPSFYTLFVREDGSMAQDLTASTSAPASPGWTLDPKFSPRYRVTLVFNPPTTGQMTATPVRVLVTWPAIADPKPAKSLSATDNFPSKFSGSFEVVTGLDRN